MNRRHRYWLLAFCVVCMATGLGWLAFVAPLAWWLAEEVA